MDSVLGLTSHGLLAVMIAAAVLAPLALAGLWALRRTPRSWPQRAGWAAGALVLALTAQAGAVGAIFLAVNGQYQFYSSWDDLLGEPSGAPSAISLNGSVNPDHGKLEILPVDGSASHTRSEVLVWLPPEYHERAFAHHRFPVVMFLPGQPEQPMGAFQGFQLASTAESAIASHQVPPFVLVVPPLMIRPPSDTECTNVPHGPRAESWLAHDVPTAITHDLRVDPLGRHWSVMGWSTGGFCAAKLVYGHPREFHAAVSLGAYFQPITKGSWPHLFGGSLSVRNFNSPQWLYLHQPGGLTGHLLIVSSKQDGESWASSAQMLAATDGNPRVSHVVLGSGGHNFHVYRPYTQDCLRWLAGSGALGGVTGALA